jgi:hypothetical protein
MPSDNNEREASNFNSPYKEFSKFRSYNLATNRSKIRTVICKVELNSKLRIGAVAICQSELKYKLLDTFSNTLT